MGFMKLQKYQKCSKVTRGLRKAEFVLKNARIVNVFTREILKGDIAIEDGLISGIGSYEGKREIDLEGRYVCPGLIDSHRIWNNPCDTGRACNSGCPPWDNDVYCGSCESAKCVRFKGH